MKQWCTQRRMWRLGLTYGAPMMTPVPFGWRPLIMFSLVPRFAVALWWINLKAERAGVEALAQVWGLKVVEGEPLQSLRDRVAYASRVHPQEWRR